jgi:hypothetical protein
MSGGGICVLNCHLPQSRAPGAAPCGASPHSPTGSTPGSSSTPTTAGWDKSPSTTHQGSMPRCIRSNRTNHARRPQPPEALPRVSPGPRHRCLLDQGRISPAPMSPVKPPIAARTRASPHPIMLDGSGPRPVPQRRDRDAYGLPASGTSATVAEWSCRRNTVHLGVIRVRNSVCVGGRRSGVVFERPGELGRSGEVVRLG